MTWHKYGKPGDERLVRVVEFPPENEAEIFKGFALMEIGIDGIGVIIDPESGIGESELMDFADPAVVLKWLVTMIAVTNQVGVKPLSLEVRAQIQKVFKAYCPSLKKNESPWHLINEWLLQLIEKGKIDSVAAIRAQAQIEKINRKRKV